MDLYLLFALAPNGSMRLCAKEILQLESALSAARAQNKPVSIELICEENRNILLHLQDRPTTSSAWPSTSSPRHLCWQQLELLGKEPVESGEAVMVMRSISVAGTNDPPGCLGDMCLGEVDQCDCGR